MDFLVGIVLFLVLGAVVLVPFYLRYLTRAKELDALVKLGEGGADVQVMLAAMMKQQSSLRQVVWVQSPWQPTWLVVVPTSCSVVTLSTSPYRNWHLRD